MRRHHTKRSAWVVIAMMVGVLGCVAGIAKLSATGEPPMCVAAVRQYAMPGVASNLLIAAAYAWIPAVVIHRGSKYRETQLLAYAFAAFIVSCGAGHLLDALAMGGLLLPAAMDRALDGVTALVSIVVAWAVANMDAQITRRERASE